MSFNSVLIKIIISDVVLAAMLCVAQLWDIGLPAETFTKVLVTMLIIGVTLGLIIITRMDFSDNNSTKDDDYIGQ